MNENQTTIIIKCTNLDDQKVIQAKNLIVQSLAGAIPYKLEELIIRSLRRCCSNASEAAQKILKGFSSEA